MCVCVYVYMCVFERERESNIDHNYVHIYEPFIKKIFLNKNARILFQVEYSNFQKDFKYY